MSFVLFTFRDNAFADSQSLSLHNSRFNKCSSAEVPVMSQNSVVSSAYRIILNRSVHDGKSLIYTEKRKSPRTEAWGTPVLISNVSEMKPLKSTTNCRL